jgi:hypothetical protein
MSNEQGSIVAPMFTRKHIVDLADALTIEYAHCVGLERARHGISFEALYRNVIYPRYEIEIVEDCDLGFDQGQKILGSFDPVRNIAFIDKVLSPRGSDPRRAFTCCHEVGGHGVLQGNWLRSELKQLDERSQIVTTQASMSPETETVLERQANLFASHMAAPTWLVVYAIQRAFKFDLRTRFIFQGRGHYSFCTRWGTRKMFVEDFEDACKKIAFYIKRWFHGLSVEALGYRVQECPLVIDQTARSFHLHRVARPERQLQAV